MTARPPTVRERRLAGELRRLRESTTALNLEEAAEGLGWSKTKLSRIENAIRKVTAAEVQQMLALYSVTGPRLDALVRFSRTTRQRGWWDVYENSLPTDYATYMGLEAESEWLNSYTMGLVHGLMQTEDYTHHVARSILMRFSPASEVERRVAARMARQRAWTERADPTRLWTILDETALQRVIGGPEVMRAQCRRIIELTEQPNVMFQIMPLAAGGHPGVVGSFAILGFPERFTPNVVYVENMTSALYVEDEREVHTYALAFEQMAAMALSPEESVAMLERLARQ
ncbi:XRE family transcriptional regulator [Actinomadura darangshiensis]|uniref:XRE family transcriptional regulator n=1 Tax=Actinomadura darangshiensis TaxID=705336 RepID=A0A4R4ZW01_9ACTN|nr:helix-turn-helix transcriptional regulator [Actinomadura darangshiensis]TDD62239.1 XRE family transcriptional regulator [Actinomadura darangshiensis]